MNLDIHTTGMKGSKRNYGQTNATWSEERQKHSDSTPLIKKRGQRHRQDHLSASQLEGAIFTGNQKSFRLSTKYLHTQRSTDSSQFFSKRSRSNLGRPVLEGKVYQEGKHDDKADFKIYIDDKMRSLGAEYLQKEDLVKKDGRYQSRNILSSNNE